MSQDPDDPCGSTSSPNFQTIFADALKQYKKQTKKDIAAHSLAAQIESCDSPNAILTVLQTQVQMFDSSPSANDRWSKLLDPTVTVLYAFSGFVSNIARPVLSPGAAIFTGIGVLLQVVKDVHETQDILIDLFDRMKFFFMRLEKFIAVKPTAAMTDIIVQIMVEVINILGIATKEIEQGQFKKYVKKLFGIHRVEGAFQRLDKFTQEGARMAEVEILTIATRIDEEIQAVSELGSDLNRNLSREALRQWTDPPDRSSNFYAASDAHYEGTSVWCIEGKAFADWMASGSLLWIHGKPGSGKTILSSVIIRDIQSMCNAGLAFLAYFYFDFKDEGKNDSRALLSSLLDQLSGQSDQFRDVLRGLYSEHENGLKQPHNDALVRCLKDMLTIAGSAPAYLVIDALNECPNASDDRLAWSPRGKVLGLVKELVGLRLPNLRLCITSRPELDIRTIIKPLATQEISLHDESGQNRDINAYVTFVVQSVKHWRDVDKKMVIDKLTEDADGMFRWIYCKLEVLRQCHRNDLRRILKEFPQSLDETYQRILKEINDANRKQAHRLLQCLVAARRPLQIEELAVVLALDVDAGGVPRFNAEWRWEDHEAAVLSTCSSLVSVANDGSRVVQFCHFSVKEFLMSDRLASLEDISQFHIAHEPSHATLAQACLGVLLSVYDPTSEDSARGSRLSVYAHTHWLGHAQVRNAEFQIKDALDRLFDLDKPHCAAFFRHALASFNLRFLRARSDEESKGVLTPAALFYFAAISGLSGLAERLIVAMKPQVIDFCGHKGTLLHLAVREGQIDAVRLLLAHGADINSRKDCATPPHIASLQGFSQGLEIHSERLLDRGLGAIGTGPQNYDRSEESGDADMGPGEERGYTPLHLAAAEGHLDMCQVLLERNADVRVHDNSGDTPLHLAASSHHLEIARILLKYNADVNSQNEDGSTPLDIASSRGNLDVLRLFLAHNADAVVDDNRGSTLLHLVSIRSHLELARSLNELKADINASDDEGSTLVQRVSQDVREGYLEIMRLLLDHGANLNALDKSGNTALHFAASEGHLEVVRMLLELKAGANSLDSKGLTPLQRASRSMRERYRDILRLLLDYGANVNAHDKSGNTALHFAASKGHLEVARVLLELKADINSLNEEGSTPLHQASQCWWKGGLELVQLLLKNGAGLHPRDNSGNTPLHFAASRGRLEVTRMLLELKANVNSLDDKGLTPLHHALEDGPRGDPELVQLVRLLLDNGADLHACDKSGNTPLHFAASRGRLEVTRMLLELKANVNSLNDKGSTPLHLTSQVWSRGTPDTVQLVQLLFDSGADLHARDNSGNTPLHFAASKGRLEVTRMLLELKANVNSLDDKGLTPLHHALEDGPRGDPELVQLVRLLLDNGADLHACDESGNTPLHFAASRGRLEVARILLELKANVNSLDDKGSTPLHQTSQVWSRGTPDTVQLVQLLFDNGADLNARDSSGNTPLHLAAYRGHLKVARMLLELQADVNSLDDKGSTPLHQTSQVWSRGTPDTVQLVQLLFDNGADLNARDSSGNTPLHLAACRGHLEVACMLLELKANVNSLNDKGSTPLHHALEDGPRGDPELVQLVRLLLENGADLHACDKSGNTPLHFAASRGRLEVTRMLLELKANVNSLDDKGSTPLHQTSQVWSRGSPDAVQLVQLLFDDGADLNARDSNGNTPLHSAASEGHLEVARMLLELKADVNSLNEEGSSPLHQASQSWRCDPDLVRLLFDNGADLHARDNSGNTPLHSAASESRLEVARMLLELKVDVNSLNEEGSSPLHQASQSRRGDPDLVQLLFDNGADLHARDNGGDTPLHSAASESRLEVARMLLELKADVNSLNDKGSTPLHKVSQAWKKGHPDTVQLVKLLFDHGADMNARDNSRNTPLHFAVFRGHLEVTRMLLELKADVNSLGDKGSTPLHETSHVWLRGQPDIVQLVQLLFDNGADLRARDNNGNTPLHSAVYIGHLEVARMLLERDAEVNSQNSYGSTPLHLASAGYEEGNLDLVRLLLDHGADVQVRKLTGETASEIACGPYKQEIAQLLSLRTVE
ncbi:Ankyrin repeat-containing domain protein [Lactarius tabidus]